jgi:hypothetical protein
MQFYLRILLLIYLKSFEILRTYALHHACSKCPSQPQHAFWHLSYLINLTQFLDHFLNPLVFFHFSSFKFNTCIFGTFRIFIWIFIQKWNRLASSLAKLLASSFHRCRLHFSPYCFLYLEKHMQNGLFTKTSLQCHWSASLSVLNCFDNVAFITCLSIWEELASQLPLPVILSLGIFLFLNYSHMFILLEKLQNYFVVLVLLVLAENTVFI